MSHTEKKRLPNRVRRIMRPVGAIQKAIEQGEE